MIGTLHLPIALTIVTACSARVLAEPVPGALPRSHPEAQGISPAAILRFIDAAEERIDALHGLVLVRHGSVVAEGW